MVKSKGFIDDEKEWLLTPRFALDEASTANDGTFRNTRGQHYLGLMNEQCGFCGVFGFQSEVKGSKVNQQHPGGEKVKYLGSLCCNSGKVKGICDYNLPKALEELYTSSSKVAIDFRKDARTYNNGMAMSSVTATQKWRNRAHNGKMEAMLTAGGQLLRRAGPLIAANGERPKCVQTYFYGGDEATKWRLINTRKTMTGEEKATYATVLESYTM